ncbi:MAG: hypothetical protein ABIZ49_11655, partial [Opitutaceae bacterium]
MNAPDLFRRLNALLLVIATSAVFAQPAPTAAPAPIPAAVAIARPSPAEIAKAAESLQRFVGQADPATKAIAAKYPELISVRPPRVNPAVVP